MKKGCESIGKVDTSYPICRKDWQRVLFLSLVWSASARGSTITIMKLAWHLEFSRSAASSSRLFQLLNRKSDCIDFARVHCSLSTIEMKASFCTYLIYHTSQDGVKFDPYPSVLDGAYMVTQRPLIKCIRQIKLYSLTHFFHYTIISYTKCSQAKAYVTTKSRWVQLNLNDCTADRWFTLKIN